MTRERGSAALELTILAPALLAVVSLVLAYELAPVAKEQPGLAIVAAIVAAALSPSINSLAATTVNDFYVKYFGFTEQGPQSPAFAAVQRGNLRLLLSGPQGNRLPCRSASTATSRYKPVKKIEREDRHWQILSS